MARFIVGVGLYVAGVVVMPDGPMWQQLIAGLLIAVGAGVQFDVATEDR